MTCLGCGTKLMWEFEHLKAMCVLCYGEEFGPAPKWMVRYREAMNEYAKYTEDIRVYEYIIKYSIEEISRIESRDTRNGHPDEIMLQVERIIGIRQSIREVTQKRDDAYEKRYKVREKIMAMEERMSR